VENGGPGQIRSSIFRSSIFSAPLLKHPSICGPARRERGMPAVFIGPRACGARRWEVWEGGRDEYFAEFLAPQWSDEPTAPMPCFSPSYCCVIGYWHVIGVRAYFFWKLSHLCPKFFSTAPEKLPPLHRPDW